MKLVLILLCVALATFVGCSDDGVYTPVEQTDPPPSTACEQKAGCPDAGDEMDSGADADVPFLDAGKQ